MDKKINLEELEKQYLRFYPKFEAFCSELIRQIQIIVNKEGITLAVPIQYRAKKWDSIFNKLEQKRFTIKKSILELQDLAGLRIILLFNRDVEQIINLVKSNFNVLKFYRTDEKLEDNQFGYSSIHLVFQVPESWANIPSISDFVEMKAELQIRTLSQHSWAEASNIFHYKREESVPKPLRRSISRISALLEIIDLEYERLLKERENYKEEINSKNIYKIKGELDIDLLKEILDNRLPKKNKHQIEPYSELLDNLTILEFNEPTKLDKLITENLEFALEADRNIAANTAKELEQSEYKSSAKFLESEKMKAVKQGVHYSHVGLIRTMLTHALGNYWDIAIKEKLNG